MQLKVLVEGVVQGVGFRPFVYRVAKKHGLGGYVKNLGDAGVEIVVQGKKDSINKFLIDLEEKKPPISRIDRVKKKYINSSQFTDFKILKSSKRGKMEGVSVIPPDIGVCDDCVSEMFDEGDERYMYPFINCTNCGPRFSIFWDLPYDRPLTSMKEFLMCDFCEEEYTNPMNRRYHAQPICCPSCGPTYSLYQEKIELEKGVKAVKAAAKFLDSSKIVAIKGIGGFHIAC
ncbi:MAG: acylphosphatase, partial [Candidatus Methanofastidiosia archaeon]